MGDKKPTLIDWLGLRREPDFSRARWLGGLISVSVVLVVLVLVGLTGFQFFKAVAGLSEFASAEAHSSAIRNSGLVLAAVIGVPFLVWRTVVAQKLADTAEESLFNDKINAAADDLHARRLVTMNPDEKENRWDYWQDDIVKRNAAIDRLEGLVRERPDTAERIARMLSIYVRELSAENEAQVVPKEAKPNMVLEWARALTACRSDMENAVQTLGRLKAIEGVDPDKVPIDLRGANLQGFFLNGANFDNARLNRAKMQGTNLSGAKMQGAGFYLAEMQGAILRWAMMRKAILIGAKMQGTVLSDAQMQEAHLNESQMQGAVLDGAQIQGAIFWQTMMDSTTSLKAANLQNVALKEVDYGNVSISQAQVGEIFYDGSVNLPDNLIWDRDRSVIEDWSEFQDQWRAWQKKNGFEGM